MAPRPKKKDSQPQTKVYESVKKGLDIMLKSFYEDDTLMGDYSNTVPWSSSSFIYFSPFRVHLCGKPQHRGTSLRTRFGPGDGTEIEEPRVRFVSSVLLGVNLERIKSQFCLQEGERQETDRDKDQQGSVQQGFEAEGPPEHAGKDCRTAGEVPPERGRAPGRAPPGQTAAVTRLQ